MWRAIRIAFHRNRGHGDHRCRRQPLLDLVESRLARSEAESPAIVVNDDRDMIRIVEGRCATIERGVGEVPFGRSELPDELGKFMPVLFVAGAAAFRRKIVWYHHWSSASGGKGILPAAWLPIRYPLTETIALHRSGQSAAMMAAVRAPQ